jgi:hypothetical protein
VCGAWITCIWRVHLLLQIECLQGTDERSYLHVAGVGGSPERALKLLQDVFKSLHALQQPVSNDKDDAAMYNSSSAASLTLNDAEAYAVFATATNGSGMANTVPTSHNRNYSVSKAVEADSKAFNNNCCKRNDSNNGSAVAGDMASAFAPIAVASRRATTCTVATAKTSVATSTQKPAKRLLREARASSLLLRTRLRYQTLLQRQPTIMKAAWLSTPATVYRLVVKVVLVRITYAVMPKHMRLMRVSAFRLYSSSSNSSITLKARAAEGRQITVQ